MFTLYPAIDLRQGRVVRLLQGRADKQVVYSDAPVETARRWQDEGATWLHIVNLDGAFGDADTLNMQALEQIIGAVNLQVQFGGGLRNRAAVSRVLGLGVRRVVVGTMAVEQPACMEELAVEFGAERVIVAIETRGGELATRGWVEATDVDAIEFGKEMRARGVTRALVTDIARDGMLGGVVAQAMAAMARETGLQVIAAGGVASLDDIDALAAVCTSGVEGVTIGQALYTGAFTLREALARVQAREGLENAPQARQRKPRDGEA